MAPEETQLMFYRNVKALVGEMDFSFHVVSTSASSTLSDDTLWTVDRDKGKKD
jgi:hypothetical protein